MSSNVFVIINEWTDLAGNTSSEVVGGAYFTSEGEAWDSLAIIAEELGEHLPHPDTSFVSENNHNLQFEEYYIQELTQLRG